MRLATVAELIKHWESIHKPSSYRNDISRKSSNVKLNINDVCNLI